MKPRVRRILGSAVTLGLVLVPLTACATKQDLKNVRQEMIALQERQDTIFVLLQQENRATRDSIFEAMQQMVRTRGEIRNQLLQMEQQLIQIQELTGQSQRRLGEMREAFEERRQAAPVDTALPGGVRDDDPAEPVEGGGEEAEELYRIGTQQLEQEGASTARMAFEQLLRENPRHPRAPDAQFGIAETYVLDQRMEEALAAYERVGELYPDSPRAPEALFRAGVLAEEDGNISAARRYFERVRAGYPRSDEARLAGDALERLRDR